MSYTDGETPSAAFGLTLAGGILILLVGLFVSVIGAALTFFMAGVGGLFGLLGVVWGVLLIVCAFMLRSNPQNHVTLGVAIILLSLFSWVGAFGGFLIGFVLALIGGILALIWSPTLPSPSGTFGSGSTVTMVPPPPPAGAARFCPSCGSPVEAGQRFCRSCGKPL
jgi:uncharacterized protein DUF6114/zinc ribbon protein